MTNALITPKAFDRIAIDGQEMPVLCRRLDGGTRDWEFQDQMQPGFTGAFSVLRKQNLAAIGYQFRILSALEWVLIEGLVDKLMAGNQKRPPKEYDLGDPRLEGLKLRRVAAQAIGPWEQEKPGGVWTRKIAWKEVGKRIPIGGPLQKPTNEIERKIAELNAENKALDAQLNAQKAAAKKGK